MRQLKLSVNMTIWVQKLKNIAEDDYLKIKLSQKEQYYDH